MTNKVRLFNSGIYYQASGIHPETGDWVVATLYHGECSQVLQEEDIRPTACVTDPPYGLEFMGKQWDSPWKYDKKTSLSFAEGSSPLPSFNPNRNPMCRSCKKPERGAKKCQCKDPDFDTQAKKRSDMERLQSKFAEWFGAVRDALSPGGILLAFGGTRVYHRLVCGLEDAEFEIRDCLMWLQSQGFPKSHNIHKATGDDAWKGYGTSLKPAYEPIVLAMKPTDGSFANNALTHGVAGLNIDECRIGNETVSIHDAPKGTFAGGEEGRGSIKNYRESTGRFPANLILSDDGDEEWRRFFYCPKPSKKEKGEGNNHPTVKPINLMAYLVRMVKMPSGTLILDPFNGSGTTGLACLKEGVDYIGIELSADYLEITKARLEAILREWESVLTTSNIEPCPPKRP